MATTHDLLTPDTTVEVVDPAAAARRPPHLARGPFVRWPRTADAALALLVFVATVAAVALSELDDGVRFTIGSVLDLPVGAHLLVAVGAGALWWRRARPIEVTVVVFAVMVVWAFAGFGDGNDLLLVVAVYSVGRYASDRRLGATIAVVAIVVGEVGTLIDDSQRVDLLPAVVLTILPWYVGSRVRNRIEYVALLRERAERLESEQQSRARQAAADERARIARELHDVVAHQVSMMTVQAGAAKTIARSDLDAAIDAMSDVEHAGRQTLSELRHLLGVLRPDTGAVDELGPQRGLADVPTLVAELAQTGADVRADLTDPPPGMSTAVELSAYRILQEALTNVIKHAGTDPVVEIVVSVDEGRLEIDVTNTLGDDAAPGAAFPTSGYGIAGMRERVGLLGGTLTAGVVSSGRFRVHASLPTGAVAS